MTQINNLHDKQLVVVGSGMVGCVLALALAPYVKNILLLDQQRYDSEREPNIHSRPISLNHTSVEALKQLGLWSALAPLATAITTVHVSQSGYLGTTQFHAADTGLAALGQVVPADVLSLELLKQALQHPNIHFTQIDSLDGLSQQEQQVVVQATIDKQSSTITADFVFGCDGSHSTVAQFIGSAKTIADEQLWALLSELNHIDAQGIAYERFTQDGTLALLPKLGDRMGLVFTGKKMEIERMAALSAPEFKQLIQSRMGDRLSAGFQVGAVFTRPLESIVHAPLAKGGVVLLGNAARTLYPIAAQGFNLGLRDVMQMQAVFACAADEDQIVPAAMIQTYLQARQEDQQATSNMTKQIGRLFEKNLPLLAHLRGLGLLSLSMIAPLKNKLANRALGISGKVQRILKLVDHES